MDETMTEVTQLVLKVCSLDNKVAIRAVKRLREQGWLGQRVLARTNMRFVHLQRVDFHKANLDKTDLSMADLHWSNMSWVNLKRANLNKANLYGANSHMADLEGANLIRAKLQSVCNFSEDQLLSLIHI